MLKNLTTFILSAALVPVFGTALNPNAEMELGEIGKPVPAWQTEVLLAKRDVVMKNPSRKLIAVTTKDGREGKGLVCLPDQGAIQYRLICPDLYLNKDCEVEIRSDGAFEGKNYLFLSKQSNNVIQRFKVKRGVPVTVKFAVKDILD